MNIRKQTTWIAAIPAVLIAFFIAPLAAHAGETVVSSVSFEFNVGDKILPPGEYEFQIDQLFPNTVRVRSTSSSTAVIALTRRAGDAVRPVLEGVCSVSFNVYGQQRFLSMIQTNTGTAVTLGRGSQEISLAKLQTASSVALVRSSALRKARS